MDIQAYLQVRKHWKKTAIKLCAKFEGGVWRSHSLRKLLQEVEKVGVGSYGWES